MRKFILWISMSIFLGVIAVALMSMGGSNVFAKKVKKKVYRCPTSMLRVEIDLDSPETYSVVDDNENGYICINEAGQIIDDNAVPFVFKKKK